jgi:hypothetical protein
VTAGAVSAVVAPAVVGAAGVVPEVFDVVLLDVVLLVGGSGGQCKVGIAVSSSTSRLAALAAITAFCIISRILMLRLLPILGLGIPGRNIQVY